MELPVDLREWVPADDLSHFVLAAVERVPMHRFWVNERGSGSAQYHPRMMLALLIYCYANGVFGSRRIERATYRDIGARYLTADTFSAGAVAGPRAEAGSSGTSER
jgi:transposase